MKSKSVFLIQLLLWLSMILAGIPAASAAMTTSQQTQAVQGLEDTLFTVHYDQEPLDARVNRLEQTVFGQAQTGANLEARIAKLQGSLSPKALGPLSPVAKAAPPQNTANNNGSAQSAAPNVSANNNFPTNQTLAKSTAKSANGINMPPQYVPVASSSSYNQQQVAVANPTTNSGPGSLNPNNINPSNLNKAQGSNAGQKTPNLSSAPEAGETDYPTVTQMEQKLFGKTYAKEDITQRLARLENQVFKVPQTGALSDRTDNLRMVVLGDTEPSPQPAPTIAYGSPTSSYSAPSGGYGQPYPSGGMGYGYPQPPNYGAYGEPSTGYNSYGGSPSSYYGLPPQPTYTSMPYPAASTAASSMPGKTGGLSYGSGAAGETTPDMMAAMSEVEKEVLGHTYPADSMNARLDRVETKVFKATSPDMSQQDRIQRVIAVASAGGTPMNNKAKAKATFQTLLPIILTILPLILL